MLITTLDSSDAHRLTPLKELVIVHKAQAAESRWFANRSILLYVALQRARIKELEGKLEAQLEGEVSAT